MPKQLLNIPSFEGGLNTALDPRDISLSELSRANNVMCDVNGIIRSQGKSIEHTIVGVLGTIVPGYGLFRFESSITHPFFSVKFFGGWYRIRTYVSLTES